MSDRVSHHPPELIDQLLNWCIEHATTQPEEALAVGLAYALGLNALQIAHTTVTRLCSPVTLSYPLARRIAEIRIADRAELDIDAPDWLAEAASIVAADRKPGTLLYRLRGTVGVPLCLQAIDKFVRRAGAEATGCRVSIQTLNGSRVAAVRAAGTPLALHEIGYSPRWAARLTQARPALILPEKAT
jgi:hypothetical protein